jgi:hypothetical protein
MPVEPLVAPTVPCREMRCAGIWPASRTAGCGLLAILATVWTPAVLLPDALSLLTPDPWSAGRYGRAGGTRSGGPVSPWPSGTRPRPGARGVQPRLALLGGDPPGHDDRGVEAEATAGIE